jgi:hypothetical protein
MIALSGRLGVEQSEEIAICFPTLDVRPDLHVATEPIL